MVIIMLSKEKIKAIRIVNGFNSDLRVNLRGINRRSLFEWMEANRYGIFGQDSDLANKPSWDDERFPNWEHKMNLAVTQVIEGR